MNGASPLDWRDKRYNQMSSQEASFAIWNVTRLDDHLKKIYTSFSETIIKTLILLDLGGIAAVLMYFRWGMNVDAKTLFIIALTLFCLGLGLIVFSVAASYMNIFMNMQRYQDDVKKFLSFDLSFADIRQFEITSEKERLSMRFALLSAICTYFALAAGLIAYFAA